MKHAKDGNEAMFFDTYALYALTHGSANYAKYISGLRIATSYMNLYELYHMMLQNGQEESAEKTFQLLVSAGVHPSPATLKAAAKFRIAQSKRNLSYTDCLGYAIAQDLKMPFLTGDEGFRGLPNVKFVKE
jgi:predicted nucleic acid-binding protein